MSDAPLEAVLKRDRWVVLSGLAAVTLLSWVYLVHEAGVMGSMEEMMREARERGEPLS